MKKYKKELNKEQYKQMLDDICSDYCSTKNCLLKDFLLSNHPSSRILMQMKCAEKFKIIIAERTGRKVDDIELSESMEVWVSEGYAACFADVYEEGLRYDTIYRRVISEMEGWQKDPKNKRKKN
jgi:hypothetical protein